MSFSVWQLVLSPACTWADDVLVIPCEILNIMKSCIRIYPSADLRHNLKSYSNTRPAEFNGHYIVEKLKSIGTLAV